jgi:hypothetical protein
MNELPWSDHIIGRIVAPGGGGSTSKIRAALPRSERKTARFSCTSQCNKDRLNRSQGEAAAYKQQSLVRITGPITVSAGERLAPPAFSFRELVSSFSGTSLTVGCCIHQTALYPLPHTRVVTGHTVPPRVALFWANTTDGGVRSKATVAHRIVQMERF